ncbi:hypothetical protein GO730_17520 [Spirosoma sp. HMF3257]|uniref:Uncharacterized protein n=1 Tax=Spirosoma telluris TaxID=2183553 RepID=A0A327NNX5_9BACT|nr:hypothetical protein [Spirosoma telluris]RAI75504.1 hypothetical protein HMF3257_17445 [Spirosoma telluris]
MKFLLYCLFIAPLPLWGQVDSLPSQAAARLKPIEFREIPYTYTTHSTSTYRGKTSTTYSTHTGIRRIYSYDGIDVDNPKTELWQYMDALKDADVQYQHLQFDDIVARQQTASTVGASIAIPGLLMIIAGAIEAASYKNALSKQKTAYYQTSTSTPSTPTTTGPTLANCSSWIGYAGTWECMSGPYAGQKTTTDPFAPVTPSPVPTQPIAQLGPPTTVDLPDGKGLALGGAAALLVGIIVGASASGDAGAALLKAVQYYNRALKQKFSWELQPYWQYNATGIRLVGHF